MLVKVFEAETMAEALKKVKETLGPDALIISTRTLKRGGLGLVGKSRIEITAALESAQAQPEELAQPQPAPRPAKARAPRQAEPTAEAGYQNLWRQQRVIDPVEAELRELRELVARQNIGELRSELDEIKEALRQVGSQARPQAPAAAQRAKTSRRPARREIDIESLTSSLVQYALEPETAETLARYASERLTPQQLSNQALLDRFFIDTIADLLSFSDPLHTQTEGQRKIALVGPTGVGKTTTIAKLAADYLQNDGGSIALVTLDTYRIAAVEQLRVYADILGLPVEVVYSPDRLQAAFDRHADKDLILIDTTGRSPRDEEGMAELAAFLGTRKEVEKHLVLATGTRGTELVDTVSSFARLPISSLIFTKLDECQQRGALLDLPLRKNLPLSYLTNGQRVPEDLLMAEPNLVAGLIMGNH